MPGRSDWGVPPQVQTIPPFAGPNDDSIIIGQNSRDGTVYPELASLYSPGVVVAAIIMQDARFDYVYMAYVNPTVGLSFLAFGSIESVGLVISEAYRVIPGTIGAVSRALVTGEIHITGGAVQLVQSGGVVTVESGGVVNVDSGGVANIFGSLDIESGANLNVRSGGDIEILGGGDINVASSGLINVLAGGVVNVSGSLDIESGANLNVRSGGDIEIESGGDINVQSGGDIVLASGGVLNAQSGSTVTLQPGSTFAIDNVSAPRGRVGAGFATTGSGAIGTTLTQILTASCALKQGRAYATYFGPTLLMSGSTNTANFRIGEVGGNDILVGAYGPSGTSHEIAVHGMGFFRRTAGGDATVTIELLMQASSGTAEMPGNGSTRTRYLIVMDIGDAADYAGLQEFNS